LKETLLKLRRKNDWNLLCFGFSFIIFSQSVFCMYNHFHLNVFVL
jgi:hypothetical protein